jgi:hypothetical protein
MSQFLNISDEKNDFKITATLGFLAVLKKKK